MKNRKISSKRWLLAGAFLLSMLLLTQFAFADEGEEATKYYGVLSLVTPFIAIVLSFITKQVVLSLATAVLVGATIINGGNLFHGFLRTCDTYIVGTTTDTWNATLLSLPLSGRVDCSDEQNGRNPGNGSYPGEEGKKRQELTDYHLDHGVLLSSLRIWPTP